jgi:signal transduction histidine kinase
MTRSSEQLDYRLLFESLPGLYLILTHELHIAAASDAYLHATRTRREEILGRYIFEVFPDNPGDPAASGVTNLRRSLELVLERQRADSMAVQKYDIVRPDADGGGFEERYWSPVNSPVFDAGGRLVYVVHRVEDVTDFVRYRQGQPELPVSPAAALSAHPLSPEVYLRAQEIQRANLELRAFQAQLEACVEARTAELRETTRDLERQVEEHERTSAALLHSEEQLRQAQKLEALGRLAGGIAHDFNNLLSVVLGYSALLLHGAKPGQPGHEELSEIRRAGERAAALTRQLLAFSRKQPLTPTLLDLNELISDLQDMLRRLTGDDVQLECRLDPQLQRVYADRSQIEQVVMNLAANARDAMPNGGRLLVETRTDELNAANAREYVGLAAGRYVTLAVSDTGVGMDEATRTRAFEPFFTTKAHGRGIGLGLSSVFGIVRQSGGNVWLSSEPGSGSRFTVYLPEVSSQGAQFGLKDSSAAPRGHETVLLVEDEPQVRAVANALLKRFGYTVLEAKDPGEALSLAHEHRNAIDLLLTDVVMPQMNGRQLADKLLVLMPDLKVLFMSGFTGDIVIEAGDVNPRAAFLPKPLTPDALARKVRTVLDARAS